MSLIDSSYFVGDLNIPNPDNTATAERIQWSIEKYEPRFLKKLMGYPLYKAFVAGLNVVSPATPDLKWLNILYGCEYTNNRGLLAQWKGLIVTDTPVFNMIGGFLYKQPQFLKAGVTPDFTPGINTVTFTDWIGWTPIITRTGPMTPDVDYSYDIETGELELLAPGDVFGNNEKFFVQFELRTTPVPGTGDFPNESCIADFIYYWYQRSLATQSTGIGEVKTNAENAVNDNPNQKMASAWNNLSEWVWEFIEFMDVNTTVYPDWLWEHRYEALKEFEFINPIF